MINRYSSRRQKVDESFLNKRLVNAKSYDRIAGYFSSSILEVAGEALETVTGKIRIICNSELDLRDVETAKAASLAMGREWRSHSEDKLSEASKHRLGRLYDFLASGKIEIRVLPNEVFGLLHGKAGVIETSDGSKTCFLGSINESISAWRLNYELLWEDDDPKAVSWVEEEFEALWNHPKAQPLANAVIDDVKRLSERELVTITEWKESDNVAGPIVETPVYRKQFGLWAHQKYFVKLAYDEHISGRGARFVLADQVGLGKTIQLALSAMLMALKGDRPVLVIAPKTLIWQWQEENMKLLNFPSAVWDGKAWVDENGVRHVNSDSQKEIKKCPRRMGIVSQGIITHGGDLADKLLEQDYECIIVDECHRARRRNLKPGGENEAPDPNNLMRFLLRASKKTTSMLMATATPVQLYPVEAYDLLYILSQGTEIVLGNELAKWRGSDKRQTLNLVQGHEAPPNNFYSRWDWMKNPFPPAYEDQMVFGKIRNSLDLKPTDNVLSETHLENMKPWDRKSLENMDDFFTQHNPFIRHIIRRTRSFLENTLDQETNEPYLQKVLVQLFGENDDDALILPGYLADAYSTAEEFCEALGEIMRSAGFMRTMLLRRMGSSVEAGRKTAIKMLKGDVQELELEEEEPEDETQNVKSIDNSGIAAKLGSKEKEILQRLIYQLEQNQEKDPKLIKLTQLLFQENWLDMGCIVFSQYYDTVAEFSEKVAAEKPDLKIGIYAGGSKSGYWLKGQFQHCSKEALKAWVQNGELKLIFGTDSASEGLNLQRLGTLVNLDLPWNPTRLEQRKGRIQRIGQLRDEVWVYNMRYKDSVEDRVHDLLSTRLEHIYNLFGQIPDVLEAVWVDIALGKKESAKERIKELPTQSPFELRYDRITKVDFEKCSVVLNQEEAQMVLKNGW
jgi:superfamily II DNA or RNA helicase